MEGISSLVIFISGPNLLILLHITLDKFEFKMCQNNKNLTNAKVDRVNQKSSSAPTNVIQHLWPTSSQMSTFNFRHFFNEFAAF